MNKRMEAMEMNVAKRITVRMVNEDGIVVVTADGITARSTLLDIIAEKVGWESVLVHKLQAGEERVLGPEWLKRLALGLPENRPEEVQQLHALLYRKE